jgi:hypothetical protein
MEMRTRKCRRRLESVQDFARDIPILVDSTRHRTKTLDFQYLIISRYNQPHRFQLSCPHPFRSSNVSSCHASLCTHLPHFQVSVSMVRR